MALTFEEYIAEKKRQGFITPPSIEEVYGKWLCENHWKERCDMSLFRRSFIKYTDELKAEIIRLCNADKLDELKELIEKRLG